MDDAYWNQRQKEGRENRRLLLEHLPPLPTDYNEIQDEVQALEAAIEATDAKIFDVDGAALGREFLAGFLGVPERKVSNRICMLLFFRERLARLNRATGGERKEN